MQLPAPVLRYRVLGPLAVFQDGVLLDLGTDRHRRVLAALVLHANAPVSIADLLVAVWGYDTPDDGPQQLRTLVREVRDLVDPHREAASDGELTTTPDRRYVLQVRRTELDVTVVEDSLETTRKLRAEGRPNEASREIRSALGRWRGQPLAGLDGPGFATARERLQDLRAEVLEELFGAELDANRPQLILRDLMAAVVEFPLRERLRTAVMIALYSLGWQQDALFQYENYRELLFRTTGREPSAALYDLRERMVRSDPSLHSLPPRAIQRQALPARPPLPPMPRLRPTRRARASVWAQLGGAVVPLVTFGFGSPVLFAVLAIRRRSVWLALSAAVYLCAVVLLFSGWENSEALWSDLVLAGEMIAIVSAAVQAAIVIGTPPRNQP
ncbi:BTAD domain-containing putative transcriptional regulator [Kribbella sp. NPDC026611]|uniref:AfsR/SARP family transcriptional regulator n=1 Tax=Kribbella sp. NPDC026611 TaxID=3154911 RepID=UPI003406BB94